MDKKSSILGLLLHSAKGFYDIGFNCAYNLNKDESIAGFQRISAGAVNMAFAAELFLKGLHLIFLQKATKGHHLSILFNQLPENIKGKIKKRFLFYLDNNKEMKDLPSFKMKVYKQDQDPSKELLADDKKDLDSFLEKHKTTFEDWRYLHEINSDGFSYDIDFKNMDCFIKSIIDIINESSIKSDTVLNKV